MKYIHNTNKIALRWSVFKGINACKEDLSRSRVGLFVIGGTHRNRVCVGTINVSSTSGDVSLTEDGDVIAEIPEGLGIGTYDVELVWIKNEKDFKSRCINCSRISDLFAITDDESEAQITRNTVSIKLKSQVGTYGYDGLSAYESAVLYGKTTLSEEEWIESLQGNTKMKIVELADSPYQTIQPDCYNVVESSNRFMNITLADAPNDGYLHEYVLQITSTNNQACLLCFIGDVLWNDFLPDIERDNVYIFRITNGLGTWTKF